MPLWGAKPRKKTTCTWMDIRRVPVMLEAHVMVCGYRMQMQAHHFRNLPLPSGQLAGNDFFQHARAARRTKKFQFSTGANLGGFGLLRNVGKSISEMVGQAGVFPATYPNGAKMALGRPTGNCPVYHAQCIPPPPLLPAVLTHPWPALSPHWPHSAVHNLCTDGPHHTLTDLCATYTTQARPWQTCPSRQWTVCAAASRNGIRPQCSVGSCWRLSNVRDGLADNIPQGGNGAKQNGGEGRNGGGG